MEEDIEKIENDINYNKKQIKEISSYIPFDIKLMERVENLIKGYRELEKENKQLKEYIVVAPNLDEMTAVKYSHIQREAYFKGRAEEQQKAQQIIYEHYIPKSKVKEKIEEINKEYLDILKDYGNISTDVVIDVPDENARKHLDKLIDTVRVLLELLGGEE